MQSNHVYRLPVTNIAYHVYNDDLGRAQAISRQAFQRTLASYHEHEELADLFQIELDKRERLAQERKEHEKLLKTQKLKSSKRPHPGRSLDRTQTLLPERQSLRRHLRSNHGALEGSKGTSEKALNHLKRSRRNSDISNSDISGYDDMRILPAVPRSKTSSSGKVGLSVHHERSLSSSPALPLTPSPRLTPTDSRNEIHGSVESGSDPFSRSSDQLATNQASGVSLASMSPTISSLPAHWARALAGRRKRKQAIPVHPSVVERIPGITLRIQRELQGDLLQVEILKNLDDYRVQDSNHSPLLKLQETQDRRKIKESIDSGRPGYSFFPTLSSVQRMASPDLREASPHHPDPAIISTGNTASLTWAGSNGGSAESLTTMADTMDVRSLPLSWENFSTRGCVVNKVIGKHDAQLDILEEVVQDAVARQQYAHQNSTPQSQQHPPHQDRDNEENSTLTQSPKKPSGASAGSSIVPTAVAASSSNSRTTRISGMSSSTVSSRSAPARATRSRRQISDKHGDGPEGESNLAAHEDIELVLKQKRKKKQEGRRQLGGPGSSKDEDEDDDEDDVHDNEPGSTFQKKTHQDYGEIGAARESLTGGKQEVKDGNASMRRRRKSLQSRQMAITGKDGILESRGQAPKQPNVASRSRTSSARHCHPSNTCSDNDTSSSSEDDAMDDEDYYDRNYKSLGASAPSGVARRKRTLSESKLAVITALKSRPEPKAPNTATGTTTGGTLEKVFAPPSSPQKSSMPRPGDRRKKSQTPVSVPVHSAEGIRRNKKLWSRGRNTRKEDEVVDTTSDGSSDSDRDDGDGDSKMPLVKHPQSSQSMPVSMDNYLRDRNGDRNGATLSTSPSSVVGKIYSTGTKDGISNHDSGSRTRARARSFSSTIVTTDRTNFFESALDVIDQKRRESIAKKKAAKAEADERERLERLEREQRERREKEAKERQETLVRLQAQGKAQKIEASNLPKSSKSLPGRVLRRSRGDGFAEDGSVDPDCTSCRLELSADDKALWKVAYELGEIWLPKTWGTHAILCTTCRQQYLDHHSRCTACFYVPVKEEMATSGASCSRCKAGTWLTEAARVPVNSTHMPEKKESRRKNGSDMSVH
ncbi:hypothetical protein BGZ65_001365 [Modicella reniformis]|uniref:Uncharacterized protein n=1 Tax=Modicella reniformis TaxID=1440133 RepID=A0A9P6J6K0_9FUNG|nr:hypothetical protein BGZ65_001365 [Modicella reniformis]